MTQLFTSKSILAKLMAEENISVIHKNTKTAYFDLKNRTIILPYWTDMDGALYDLLMGHEVGHALFTPAQGWHDSTHDENGKPLGRFKGFLNVIEDARIEKRAKRRFPGLGKSFSQAYKSLYERDFFGIKDIDPNKLNLIDRINIRYKLGALVPVSFTDQEREFLTDIDNAETWEDAVAIAQRVFDYCKNQQKDKINNFDDLKQEREQQEESLSDDFDESDSEEKSEYDDFDDEEDDLDEDSDYDDESESKSSVKNEEDEEDSSGSNSGSSSDETDEELKEEKENPESVTDRNFRKRENELVNASGEVYMIELPEANLENIVIKNIHAINDLESFIRREITRSTIYHQNGVTYDVLAKKCVKKFNANNKKYIMHLYKEFEMRKRATDYARVQTAKTGELNMNVLHNYKFTNDLFKKISVVPKGKNHGMILFLDMSGSMASILRNTIEQLLVLVSFCKLAKIPFDVYGFSDDWYESSSKILSSGSKKFIAADDTEFRLHNEPNFHLKHLISSSVSPKEYNRAFANLCIVVNEYYRRYAPYRTGSDIDHGSFSGDWTSSGFGLNSTPYQQTLLASREIINTFRKKYKLDIVNVIYLTDGEGSTGIELPWGKKDAVFYLVDKKTKKKVKTDFEQGSIQASMTELVRDVTGCKHIGFYLIERKSAKHLFSYIQHKNNLSILEVKNLKNQFNETNSFGVRNLGYDKYFYIRAFEHNIQDDKLNIFSDMTKAKMASVFTKSLQSKKGNRALATQFAQEIATHL